MRHGDRTRWPKQRPSSLEQLANGAASHRIDTVWTAEEQRTAVGIGELRIASREWRQGEVGYIVHIDHWGRGIGTAIARALLEIAFESMDLHRVMATCDPRNLASAAVLRKAGMTYEGRLRHTMEIRDGWRDSSVFSILADEWLALQT
jgi:[ribosomal protein S5]-alanine N-acetyltransferase